MNKEEKLKQYEQAINYLIDIQAYFEGCEYFTKKLWTKLENRKNNDPREIKVFFIHLWLHNKNQVRGYSRRCHELRASAELR